MHRKKAHFIKKERSSPGLRGRIWIDGSEGTFLGYGRIILLELIREHGSITKAAKSMEISYRHAWELVDSMNRQSPKLLVEATTGGRNGGGARLTEEGEKAVNLFWKFYEDFQDFLKHEEKKLSSLLHKRRVR
ncbi:MAG: LysR family transcriptional regulator [Nitrospirae bacterium]|nr:LysR family transcriptional regulator [Nitrospirota bacterium]